MKINDLVKEAYDNAVEKGWHETPRNPLEVHMLIVSEVAEATEAVREDCAPLHFNGPGYFGNYRNPNDWKEVPDFIRKNKPEGEAIELADAVIRIADYFGERGWDLESAIRIKMDHNKTRSFRHGGKKA